MPEKLTPLFGEKTHALTVHAVSVLQMLRAGPVPTQDLNPGLLNRLLRESLIEIVQLPSPFKTHKGKLIDHAKITEAGIQRTE